MVKKWFGGSRARALTAMVVSLIVLFPFCAFAISPRTQPDLNGDGKADLLWYNAATGETVVWLMNGLTVYSIGDLLADPNWKVISDDTESQDSAPTNHNHEPPRNDFDGDGKSDIVGFRPTTGEWFLRLSTQGYALGVGSSFSGMGIAGDVPLSGDYDGDGKADIATFRPSPREWFVRLSTQAYTLDPRISTTPWGNYGDRPVNGDFDGDGKTDIAVYRPSPGYWYIRYSLQGYAVGSGNWAVPWGIPGEIPLAK